LSIADDVAALQVKRLKRRVELARSFGKPSIIIESNPFEMLRHFVRTSDAITLQVQVGSGHSGRCAFPRHCARRSTAGKAYKAVCRTGTR